MPAVPPVTEDSVDDFTGAEGTIAEETATVGVEKANEPSEVVHPPADHLDKTPGFVADSRDEEAREKAEVVPLNEPAVLPGEDEGSLKRKRDEAEEPIISARKRFNATLLSCRGIANPFHTHQRSRISRAVCS